MDQQVNNTDGETANEIANEEVKQTRSRAEGVSDSWKNPDVAEARKQRHAVSVGGVVYKSVTEAFKALDLPLNRHIAFRTQLKNEGSKVFTHNDMNYEFKLEEPIKVEPKPKKAKKAKKAKAGEKPEGSPEAAAETAETVI